MRLPATSVRTLIYLLGLISCCCLRTTADDAVEFNRDIRPLLSDKCLKCHGPDEHARQTEWRFDVEETVIAGDAPVVVRGNSGDSELMRRILTDDPDEQMPPPESQKTLTDADKDLLRRWIDQGAKWAVHWAYLRPQKSTPPAILPQTIANPIDSFIVDRLHQAKLQPSSAASRVTLIRRLYFDLIGLPPTPEQVDTFVNDKSPQAYERLVNQLLESPHFGERLAIYWLDVVRYADSNGYHSDEPRKIAPYRDYVIDAFNNNMPFDQFVVEQLAGDLLPEASTAQHVASGFNMLLQTTSEGGAQAKEYIAKYAADRVRNTSQIFLGSTLGCAECHDHKFDPFTQKDFYSFAAFFADIQQPAVGNPATFSVLSDEDNQRISRFDFQIADLKKQLHTTTPEIAAAQSIWEANLAEQVAALPQFGDWHTIGPFTAASFDEAHATAFLDAAHVDVAQPVGGLKWEAASQYADGKVHAFAPEPNSARYLVRHVSVAKAQQIKLLLGSDDSLTVWLNGQQVHDNKASRGVALDQDKVDVDLVAGENQILLKICNGGGGHGFAFRTDHGGPPSNIRDLINVAAAARDLKQQDEIATYYRGISPALDEVRQQLKRMQAEKKKFLEARPRTMMTKTGEPRTVRLLPRGNWLDESGPILSPAVPEFLGVINPSGERGNRLDLARWIVDSDNPLTARTLVNRLWKLYFGQGLAQPLDDLGRQGTAPTHPELLDWLAVELTDSGWNLKHMIRLLVTSQTYRQTSVVSDQLRKQDPYNLLYARQSRFRLDAEIVRDNALALSGLLATDVGGRSVYPYQPAGYWRHMNFPARTWPTDKGRALYRRGVYTWWQRMFLHPSMLAFDAPTREECTVDRPRSNIPQQALVLLNDPTYVEAARAFAQRIINEGGDNPIDRINWAWNMALSRDPQSRELDTVRAVLEKHLTQYQSDPEAAQALLGVGAKQKSTDISDTELAAWTSVARILLNLHETITRS